MTADQGKVALPLYLGPALPRWLPHSVEDVQGAISDGTLTERHWIDVKERVGPGDGAKKELARDLASFANDSGALLLGVAEDKTAGTFAVAPMDLAGLPEMVEQVARSRCDPPLYVVCHPLPDRESTASRGVLLIEIPASPLAPHMVDGAYYGRGDKVRHKLHDGEVVRLHAVRTTRQHTADLVIAGEIERDPAPLGEASHVHVVAQPLASPPDLLTYQFDSSSAYEFISAVRRRFAGADRYSPSWSALTGPEPRAHGVGFHSVHLVGRHVGDSTREKSLLDVEVNDDGRVTVYCGRGSDRRSGEEGHPEVIFDRHILSLTRCAVILAGEIGASAGYASRWMFSIGVTKLAGRYAASATSSYDEPTRYSADRYVQSTEATTIELLEQPGAVTARLAGRLLRGLGVPLDVHEDALKD